MAKSIIFLLFPLSLTIALEPPAIKQGCVKKFKREIECKRHSKTKKKTFIYNRNQSAKKLLYHEPESKTLYSIEVQDHNHIKQVLNFEEVQMKLIPEVRLGIEKQIKSIEIKSKSGRKQYTLTILNQKETGTPVIMKNCLATSPNEILCEEGLYITQ